MPLKPIAIYLPQYHTIPENDEWWQKGFTEWTNVKKAESQFTGHYQPHIPLNNNYYDLSSNQVMEEQAALAKSFGIEGFCFYHYWFTGHLLLEKPLHNMLAEKKPDMPFCMCWANENWTRTWDGQDKQVLIEQHYSLDDDKKHIEYLMPFFKDERYIKIDNKPVFLMYRTELHPNIKEAVALWRAEAKKAGFDDLYLIRVENHLKEINPADHGFDAGMEFAPDSGYKGRKVAKSNFMKYLINKILHNSGIKKSVHHQNFIYSYQSMVNSLINKPKRAYKYFRCVFPSWDNSARRKIHATMYLGSKPSIFQHWVKEMANFTRKNFEEKEQLLFINAWNEWGEGCHLEPDEKHGTQYLEALKKGIEE
ncbi:glycosyltransferase WbsX family protein [Pedobacter punctiformis]|uniref:Glycoside hydrolase family 99-like domain-containing protein n=1 Tax=Pedobacter punctiformis TaxID=3004097 RepID=A0ABT4L6F7_9SPHI|nr:glycoside hydrolase family 99-like domain-containing protein [Pedobacter sp. HCMS5-2]MCZ4243493.1 glycoside hydrolase family 99-like domain-containing protein [Pedobacter sp. HCMS5-2]